MAGAQIARVITDPSGAAVVGAHLTATQTETNAVHTAVTDANGTYVMPYLPVGPYRLEMTASGFTKYLQTGILLSVSNNVAINVALMIGSTQQQIQANFADPVRFLNSPMFGRSTSMLNLMLGSGNPGSGLAPLLQTGGARSFQAALRFHF